MKDNIAVRTSCGRRDLMIAAMKDSDWMVKTCVWVLVGLGILAMALVVGIVLSIPARAL